MRDTVLGLNPFPEKESVVNSEQIGEILTKNNGQNLGEKLGKINMYADTVRHQLYKIESHRKLITLRVEINSH